MSIGSWLLELSLRFTHPTQHHHHHPGESSGEFRSMRLHNLIDGNFGLRSSGEVGEQGLFVSIFSSHFATRLPLCLEGGREGGAGVRNMGDGRWTK